VQIQPENDLSRYSMQELFVALTPPKHPRYLLLIAVEQDHLLPDPPVGREEAPRLDSLGRELLATLAGAKEAEVAAEKPPMKSTENLRQFFISKRLKFKVDPGKNDEPVALMPQMRGMSLRKGLQQIEQHKIRVRINGSGRIVAQYPLAGQPLTGIEECIVTLSPGG
jgi:cell division protein FtsI (penicillin-binding protein 3)